MIELRVLGPTSLVDERGDDLDVLRKPQQLALLTYLTAHKPGEFLRRDHLVGVFWPESPEQSARSSLSVALTHLRSSVGPDVIVNRGDHELKVNCEHLRCDAVEFEEAAAKEDWNRACRLYRGAFLAGFHLRGSLGFDDWLFRTRARLERLALVGLEKLSLERSEEGDHEPACRFAEQAFELAPRDGRVTRCLMDVLVAAGRTDAAIQAYQAHAVALEARDPGSQPREQTRQLMERLERGLVDPSARGPGTVGRSGGSPPRGDPEVDRMDSTGAALLDRLIDLLLHQGGSGRRSIFVDHVDPIFAELTLVHSDYLEALEDLRVQVSGSSADEILRLVRARKARYAPIREKVRALAAAARADPQAWPPEFIAFAGRCAGYFDSGTDTRFQEEAFSSAFTTLVDELERVPEWSTDPDRAAHEIVSEWLEESRFTLEAGWVALSKAYADARLGLMR